MNWMILDIWEVETEIISKFWIIGKPQYIRIYGKLNRRNKLWSSNKLDDNYIDDKADYSYLCGGNNDCREFINLMSNLLGWSGDFNRNVNWIPITKESKSLRC